MKNKKKKRRRRNPIIWPERNKANQKIGCGHMT